VIENLIGRSLQDDEGVNIEPSRVLKETPVGDERVRMFDRYLANLDQISQGATNLPEAELTAVIDEACMSVRHPAA
jgi:hypothetical protein